MPTCSNCMMKGTNKVTIIGAGMVGATTAYAMMIRGLASDIVIIDVNEKMSRGQVMDLNHGVSFAKPVNIVAGDYEAARDSDVVVITAGAAQKPGETRLDLVNRNTAIFRGIIPELERVAPNAIIVVTTNPVDIMTYATIKMSSYPPERVIGSGTVLDSSRFRYLLSQHCGVDPKNVHAYILGEHGDSEIPAWSLTNIGGMRLEDLCGICGKSCDGAVKDEIFAQVRDAGYHIIEAKGSTYYAIGLALVEIVEAVLRDERTVLPVSCLLNGELGLSDVCLSLPAIVGRMGIQRILDLQLSDREIQGLHESAGVLRNAMVGLDFGR